MINVSLLYSPSVDLAVVQLALVLAKGATVQDALEAAQFYARYPEAIAYPVGIFSTKVSLDRVLEEGDRLEIYRPLTQDPKQARRNRVS